MGAANLRVHEGRYCHHKFDAVLQKSSYRRAALSLVLLHAQCTELAGTTTFLVWVWRKAWIEEVVISLVLRPFH